MFSQNHVQHLLIGKASVNLSAYSTTANTPSAITVGEIAATTIGGKRYIETGSSPTAGAREVAAAAGSKFVLYKKMADGSLLKSDVLSTDNVKKVIRKTATAATEKLEYYGYNGSTGSFEVLDENFYRIRIEVKEGYSNNDHGTTYFRHAIYESDSSATQSEITRGLAKNGNAGMSREVKNTSQNAPIWFKAISNVALASDFVFDATFEITGNKGSTYLNVAAATPTYNGGTVLAVGDYLRIGTAAGATGAAVALVSDVYQVKSLPSTTTIELDRPLMTNTGAYLIADGSITVIPAATGNAADWGVALYGNAFTAPTSATVGKTAYKKMDWFSGLEGSTTTTYTSSSTSTPGVNTFEQIAELEWFCQGNEGNNLRVGYPYIDPMRSEVENTTYETIDIIYEDLNSNVIGQHKNFKTLTLAIPASNPGFWTNGTDGLADVLEDLLAGVPVYGGLVTAAGGALADGDLD